MAQLIYKKTSIKFVDCKFNLLLNESKPAFYTKNLIRPNILNYPTYPTSSCGGSNTVSRNLIERKCLFTTKIIPQREISFWFQLSILQAEIWCPARALFPLSNFLLDLFYLLLNPSTLFFVKDITPYTKTNGLFFEELGLRQSRVQLTNKVLHFCLQFAIDRKGF